MAGRKARLLYRLLAAMAMVALGPRGAFAQGRTDSLLASVLEGNGDSLFRQVLHDRDTYRLQIIYTRIDRDAGNRPHFHNFYFNLDSGRYFNPASTVKLPMAILALEKIRDINRPGLSRDTPVRFLEGPSKEQAVASDSTSENGFPSIAHYIKKAFLISDNDAYNRLYQFVTPRAANRELRAKGFSGSRITSAFLGLSFDDYRITNPLEFHAPDGTVIYRQEGALDPTDFDFSREAKIGEKHYTRRGDLIDAPIDFTRANRVPLEDLQGMLRNVMFPGSAMPGQGFRLNSDDYDFLYRYLSQYPSETNYPKYDTLQYYDSYVKFYFRSPTHGMPPGVRVFNKVGWAYGFLTDVSYVADFANAVEFMLSTTLYVNSDGVVNDDRYDYETVGWPFLYELGQTIYRYELGRFREHRPDLERFRLAYHKRPEDGRPVLGEQDN